LETNTYYIHLAIGNIRPFTLLISLSAVLLVALVVLLTHVAGAVGAAWAYLVVSVVFFPLFYRAAMRVLDLDVRALVQAFARPVVASAIMYTVVRQVVSFADPSTPSAEILSLLAAVAIGAAVFTAVDLVLWQAARRPTGAEEFVLSTLRDVLSNRRRPAIDRRSTEMSEEMALDSKV
jgi:O-antigen/teichoic acid export membrane protein